MNENKSNMELPDDELEKVAGGTMPIQCCVKLLKDTVLYWSKEDIDKSKGGENEPCNSIILHAGLDLNLTGNTYEYIRSQFGRSEQTNKIFYEEMEYGGWIEEGSF